MASEIEWIKSVTERLNQAPKLSQVEGISVRVAPGTKIPCRRRVLGRHVEESSLGTMPERTFSALLLYDQLDHGWWIPRVIVECKLKEVTPHDAFAYDFWAATCKRGHQYLRYGVLIGNRIGRQALPIRPYRYGDHFDFIISWEEEAANQKEWEACVELLSEEIKVSRRIQELSSLNSAQTSTRCSIIHRQLRFK